jgi:hypothetical protein
MGKRCEDIKCSYLAQDGSCLKPVEVKCLAEETVKNEHKDEWMDKIEGP